MTPPPRASRCSVRRPAEAVLEAQQAALGANDRLHHRPLGRDQKNLAAEDRRDEVAGGRPRDLAGALRAAADRPEELSPGREERQVALEADGQPVPARRPILAARESSRELALGPRGDVEDPEARTSIGGVPSVVEDVARERDAGSVGRPCRRLILLVLAARSLPESRLRRRGRCGSARCRAFPWRPRACFRPVPNPCRRRCRARPV